MAFERTIAVPTAQGWLFGAFVWGPEGNPMFWRVESFFDILDEPTGKRLDQVVLALDHNILMFTQTTDKSTLAVRMTIACAPHVLRTHANSPEQLPRLKDGQVDLGAWLKLGPGADASADNLAEALDGGRAAHLKLCRQDVLRILMANYDESHDAGGMTAEDIIGSAFKRRYYDDAIVSAMVVKLGAEGKIGSKTEGGVVKVHILPHHADALRTELAAIEARVLHEAQSPESQTTFPKGRVYDAWRAVESILRAARDHVWMEDAFIDSDVVALLASVPEQLPIRILTKKLYDGADASFRRLGQQRLGRLEVKTTGDIHGRRLFVDDRVWEISESIKDLAIKTASTVKPLESPHDVSKLRGDFEERWRAGQLRYCNDKGDKA